MGDSNAISIHLSSSPPSPPGIGCVQFCWLQDPGSSPESIISSKRKFGKIICVAPLGLRRNALRCVRICSRILPAAAGRAPEVLPGLSYFISAPWVYFLVSHRVRAAQGRDTRGAARSQFGAEAGLPGWSVVCFLFPLVLCLEDRVAPNSTLCLTGNYMLRIDLAVYGPTPV